MAVHICGMAGPNLVSIEISSINIRIEPAATAVVTDSSTIVPQSSAVGTIADNPALAEPEDQNEDDLIEVNEDLYALFD